MSGVEERLDRIERLMLINTKQVLTTSEVAILLCVSESRVRHLVSDRDIPYYKQGKNVYFKKSEVEEWQLKNRIPTNDEIKRDAVTYAVINK